MSNEIDSLAAVMRNARSSKQSRQTAMDVFMTMLSK